jgi:hypothetical protein
VDRAAVYRIRLVFGTARNAIDRLALDVSVQEMNRVLRYDEVAEDLQFKVQVAWGRWCAKFLRDDAQDSDFTITPWNT